MNMFCANEIPKKMWRAALHVLVILQLSDVCGNKNSMQ